MRSIFRLNKTVQVVYRNDFLPERFKHTKLKTNSEEQSVLRLSQCRYKNLKPDEIFLSLQGSTVRSPNRCAFRITTISLPCHSNSVRFRSIRCFQLAAANVASGLSIPVQPYLALFCLAELCK